MRQQIIIRKGFPRLVLFILFAFTAIFIACEKDDKYDYRVVGPDEEIPQADIMLVSGNNQTGVIGSALPDSLVVYVSENYVPKKAWTVNFKVIEGEGTVIPSAAATDINGYVATTLTPSGLPGVIKVEAKPFYSDNTVIFTATSIDE